MAYDLADMTKQELTNIISASNDIGKNIQDQGAMIVFASIAAVIFILMMLVFFTVFLKKVMPDDNTKEIIESFQESNHALFKELNKSILGLYEVIRETKKPNKRQTAAAVKLAKKSILLDIELLMNCTIIENDLVGNIKYICEEIAIKFDSIIMSNSEDLEVIGIDLLEIELMVDEITKVKEATVLKLIEAFTETVKNIVTSNLGLDILRETKSELTSIEYVDAFLKKWERKQQDYKDLSRKVRIIITQTNNEIEEVIKKSLEV